mgnify:CR=1 FL=1
MKFLKQNFLTLIVLIVLLVSVNKINSLQVKYNELNSQYFMLQSSIQNLSSLTSHYNSNQPQSQIKEVKEIMSPLDLAKYLDIEMMVVYEMAEKDSTMPYIEINGEYRFNKEAIDKWMETRNIIKTE